MSPRLVRLALGGAAIGAATAMAVDGRAHALPIMAVVAAVLGLSGIGGL